MARKKSHRAKLLDAKNRVKINREKNVESCEKSNKKNLEREKVKKENDSEYKIYRLNESAKINKRDKNKIKEKIRVAKAMKHKFDSDLDHREKKLESGSEYKKEKKRK
jgi:hypothetical protein